MESTRPQADSLEDVIFRFTDAKVISDLDAIRKAVHREDEEAAARVKERERRERSAWYTTW